MTDLTTTEVALAKAIPAATHRDKIVAAIKALIVAGAIGAWSKDVEVRRKVKIWLRGKGCTEADLPSDPTFKRTLPKLRILWHAAK
jgi:hypothetical protein